MPRLRCPRARPPTQATVPVSAERLARAIDVVERLRENAETVVIGKREQIRIVLTALACGGHVLLEDVPGTAKTVLARALAGSIEGAQTSRVQCTPDIQPTDVTGLSIWDPRERQFEFRPGPVFANVLLVDEINRAMPKTQSALLEAMAERQVTVDGTTRPLPAPFFLIATENPIEQEGTFPLPEAQLDRFFLRTSLGYPGRGRGAADRAGSARRPSARCAAAGRLDRGRARAAGGDRRRLRRPDRAALDRGADPRDARGRVRLARRVGARQPRARARDPRRGRSCTAATTPSRRTSSSCSRRSSRTACCSSRSSSSDADLDADEIARRVWQRCLELAPRPAPDWEGRSSSGDVPARGVSRPARLPARSSRRRLVGSPFGAQRSARRGRGSETAGTRPYLPGDPIATIEWVASARLSAARGADEFIVRERFAEEAPRVAIVLDRRPSMAIYEPAVAVARQAARRRRSRCARSSRAPTTPGRRVDAGRRARARAGLWQPARGRGEPRARTSSSARGSTRRRTCSTRAISALARSGASAARRQLRLRDLRLPRLARARVAGAPSAASAADVVPVVVQDPTWERSFPDVPGVLLPVVDVATGERASRCG